MKKCWCFIGSGFLRVVVVSILKYELGVQKLYFFSYSCEGKNEISPHDAPRTSRVRFGCTGLPLVPLVVLMGIWEEDCSVMKS